MKKVILSKTFTNEAEYQHFQKLYDANTTAFENRWNLEVVAQGESAPAPEAAPQAPETAPPPEAVPSVDQPAEEAPAPAPAENAPEAAPAQEEAPASSDGVTAKAA